MARTIWDDIGLNQLIYEVQHSCIVTKYFEFTDYLGVADVVVHVIVILFIAIVLFGIASILADIPADRRRAREEAARVKSNHDAMLNRPYHPDDFTDD